LVVVVVVVVVWLLFGCCFCFCFCCCYFNSVLIFSDCLAHVSLLPCAELASHKINYVKERLDTYFLNAVQKQVCLFLSFCP
jgi:hypothetical protein